MAASPGLARFWIDSPSDLGGIDAGIREAVARARGACPLAEIAAQLGFADQAHLSREMRELWGTTPARLRATSDFFKTPKAALP